MNKILTVCGFEISIDQNINIFDYTNEVMRNPLVLKTIFEYLQNEGFITDNKWRPINVITGPVKFKGMI